MLNVANLFALPLPQNSRGFMHPELTRKWMTEYAVASFDKALNKLESKDYKIVVKNIKAENRHFTHKDLKDATQNGKDLTIPIKGSFQMIDKRTGEIIDKKDTTIAHIPYITAINTVIYNGTMYSIANQQRLMPGVYNRINAVGEPESHINVQAGTGLSGKLNFDPATQIFLYIVGTMSFYLYSLLHDLGTSDTILEDAWGKEVFAKNKAKYNPGDIEKLYKKLFERKY